MVLLNIILMFFVFFDGLIDLVLMLINGILGLGWNLELIINNLVLLVFNFNLFVDI